MKNLKISMKMFIGFGCLILISVILGGMAVVNMTTIKTQSVMLADEYVPEVEVAVNLRGASNRTMYAMRGYGLTEDERYYGQVKTELGNVETALIAAEELERNSPNLKALKGQLSIASRAVDTYKNLVQETVEINSRLADERSTMDAAAGSYMQSCANFLKAQNERMHSEILSKRTNIARLKKITLVNDIIDAGNNARIGNFKAQATRNPKALDKVLNEFESQFSLFDELRSFTKLEADLREIDETQEAASEYANAIKAFLSNWYDRDDLGTKRDIAGKEVIAACVATADAGMENTQRIADGAASALGRSSNIMIIGLLMALAIGITLAVLLSKAISVPIQAITKIAEKLSLGDVNQSIDLNQKDEIGQLADSFRAMINSQKEKAQGAEHIASGNLSTTINVASKDDVLGNAMTNMITNLKMMNEEIDSLTREALNGNLKNRGDAGRHQGDYGKMIEGLNNLLDAVIEPINEAMDVMSKAADKVLTARVDGDYKGQLKDFKENINSALGSLDDALNQVQLSAEQIGSASNQIASGSQSLAEGTNEQSSTLEEVSSSLEEMSSMTQQNAQNAAQATILSGEASTAANSGNESMKTMIGAIDKIKVSADETAKIVKTIDEIAFQTNLLALNAAVEAARAGDAGKGFAVVAEEVRNLAQRSAEAAKNTAELISESVQNAEGGVKISQEVGSQLTTIVESIGKTTNLVSEIDAASKEQAQGIEQVNTAVAEMNKVTQQNAANSEESASASEELNSQAEELNAMISEFTLSTSQRQSVASAPKRKRAVPMGAKNLAQKAVASKNGNGKHKKVEVAIPLDDDDFGDF